jgi:hypothetical protein
MTLTHSWRGCLELKSSLAPLISPFNVHNFESRPILTANEDPAQLLMRLINTSTYQLEEFFGSQIPKYAILSHTWEDEEVSFKDISDGTHAHKKGFVKIAKTCELAASEGLAYAWVDTCCIDKSSSAELTEAINSMFRWYERAEVCYAFLSDLPVHSDLDKIMPSCRWL